MTKFFTIIDFLRKEFICASMLKKLIRNIYILSGIILNFLKDIMDANNNDTFYEPKYSTRSSSRVVSITYK